MDSIDLIDWMDGLEREEGFSFMLGAVVRALCSLSLIAGRSLILIARTGVSAGIWEVGRTVVGAAAGGSAVGAAKVGGAGGSVGAAAVCGVVPLTCAAFSLGVGPGRWRGLAALSWCGELAVSSAAGEVSAGPAASDTSWGRSLILWSGWCGDRGRSWVSSSSTAQLPTPST